MNECAVGTDSCGAKGQTCVNTQGGFHCEATVQSPGNAACWSGQHTFDYCCINAGGNDACWSGKYTFDYCCTGDGGH